MHTCLQQKEICNFGEATDLVFGKHRVATGGEMEISRSALYDLVWSHPMTEFVKLYGIPAVKIARACDKYDIVRPRAGYWKKLAVGKAPEISDIISVEYSPDDLVTLPDTRPVTP